LIAIAVFTSFALTNPNRARILHAWSNLWFQALGWGRFAVPLFCIALGVLVISRVTKWPIRVPWSRAIGAAIIYLAALALTHHLVAQGTQVKGVIPGGLLGRALSLAVTRTVGWPGGTVLLITATAIGLVLLLDVPLSDLASDLVGILSRLRAWLASRHARRETPAVAAEPKPAWTLAEPLSSPAQSPSTQREPHMAATLGSSDQPMDAPATSTESSARSQEPVLRATHPTGWVLPDTAKILATSEDVEIDLADIRHKARTIEETLRSLRVPVTVVEVNPGPVVTQYGVEPGYLERRTRSGEIKRVKVKVSRIAALSNDLALALAASPIRIEAPVPGKGMVGLEVPNASQATVDLHGVIESDTFQAIGSRLAIAFGRDVTGSPVVGDLVKMPHLLIAGATGSGKSVSINALIACLLCRNTPEQLRLLMIDPKRVELSVYDGIPHLLAPVIVETQRVVGVLSWLVREMEGRYKKLAEAGVRNTQG